MSSYQLPPPQADDPTQLIIDARPVNPAEPETTWRSRQAFNPGDAPEWKVWSWSGGRTDDQPGVSWLGVFLVLVGVALIINQVNHSIDVGSMILLALGIAFAAAWLIGGWRSATVPAFVLIALGGAGLAVSLEYVSGPGWTSLALGIAFLGAWAVGLVQERKRTWALWIGLLFGVYGVAKVAPQLLPGLPDVALLWPAVLIGIGVVLLVRRRMDDGTGVRRL